MRKPTRKETFFLAVIGTTASLATVEIIPKVIDLYQKKVVIAEVQFKSKKSIPSGGYANESKDAFSTGLLMGLVVGTLGTTKIIADKLNNP